jgi:hypothetical protein
MVIDFDPGKQFKADRKELEVCYAQVILLDQDHRMKVHVPPCVVLIINDNPYGLIFVLSYIYRICP